MNHIACVKYGTKYGSNYVNTLFNMVKRHCTLDIVFHCYTDDASELHPDIQIIPLRGIPDYNPFFYKLHVFQPNFIKSEGVVLFLDLDVVILSNIDKLFTFEPTKFAVIRDFDARRNGRSSFNSSCFRFVNGTSGHIYSDFVAVGAKNVMAVFPGDQEWIEQRQRDFVYWPDDWFLSYKWEMLNNIPNDSAVAVFHGRPKPHEVNNTWVKENWR